MECTAVTPVSRNGDWSVANDIYPSESESENYLGTLRVQN